MRRRLRAPQELFEGRPRLGFSYTAPPAALARPAAPVPEPEPTLDETSLNADRHLVAWDRNRKVRIALVAGGAGAAVAAALSVPVAAIASLAVGGGTAAMFMSRAGDALRGLNRRTLTHDDEVQRIRDRNAEMHREWLRRVQQIRDDYERSVANHVSWEPLTLESTSLEVIGGTPATWTAMVTTLGAGFAGAGHQLRVLDLTARGTAAELAAVFDDHDQQCAWGSTTKDQPGLDPLTGLTHNQVASAVVAAAADDEIEASLIAPLIEDSLDLMNDDPFSGTPLQRVKAAMMALADRPGHGLSHETVRKLTLDAGAMRNELLGQAFRLQGWLRTVARSIGDGGFSDSGHLVAAIPPSVTQDDMAMLWAARFLAELNRGPKIAVIIVGAEKIEPKMRALLLQSAQMRARRIVMIHTDDSVMNGYVARGGTDLAICRLTSGSAARIAAEMIGSEYRFVLSQVTQSFQTSVADGSGDSTTTTRGSNLTASDDPDGYGSTGLSSSRAWGTSRQLTATTGETQSATSQRSEEFLMRPEEIQNLPETAFVFIRSSGGDRLMHVGDANPDLVTIDDVKKALEA